MKTPKQLSAAANRINSRLRRAKMRFPNSAYVNEMERRIAMMTTGYDLINITDTGFNLTRSKQKWAAVPPALAEAITDEILAVGNLFVVTDHAKKLLQEMPGKPIKNKYGVTVDYMPVEPSEENIRALLEGTFNEEVTENKIWSLAYEMRTQNHALYDMFGEMHGKKMENWKHTFDEYSDMLREAMLNPDAAADETLPSSYGLNQRTEERSNAARAIGRALADPATRNDPDALARLFAKYGQADYGTTENGVYTPADYNKLSPDQIRGILRKFLK